MKTEKFWQFVGRFKIVVELVAALIVLVPVVLAFLQNGLAAAIPAWLAIPAILAAGFLGYLLGRKPASFSMDSSNGVIQSINFDYRDSPTEHGWTLPESEEETRPRFKHVADGYYGSVLEIRQVKGYAMDFVVSQTAGVGTAIEFIAQLETGAHFMTRVRVYSRDLSKSRSIWFTFHVGADRPRRVDEGTEGSCEYVVGIKPARLQGGWGVFRINLKQTVRQTAGQEGWEYGEIECFRLRGNQSIAGISIHQ